MLLYTRDGERQGGGRFAKSRGDGFRERAHSSADTVSPSSPCSSETCTSSAMHMHVRVRRRRWRHTAEFQRSLFQWPASLAATKVVENFDAALFQMGGGNNNL